MAPTNDNPYNGPSPFALDRQQYFFGRRWEVEELRNLLVAKHVVLLHAPSGAGKTSLLEAGLIPRLLAAKIKVLPKPIRVNKEPATLSVVTPHNNRYCFSTLFSINSNLAALGRGTYVGTPLSAAALAGKNLLEYLDERFTGAKVALTARNPLVLIFDQFEEIFTLDPNDIQAKHTFFEQIGQVLYDDHGRFWAIFVMRDEHVASLAPYLDYFPDSLSARLRLELLATEGAREAIKGPAMRKRVHFARGVVTKLIDDLRAVRVQRPDGSVDPRPQPGPYIEPVQLQVVCHRLWKALSATSPPPKSGIMTIAMHDLEAIGRVDKALAEYYAEVVSEVAASPVARNAAISERDIRDWFESRLIIQNIRSQVLQQDKKTQGLPNDLIEDLADAHLVRAERRDGRTWYELAHDRLIEPVLQSNADWKASPARFHSFQDQAALWERNRSASHLLTEDALREAGAWARDNSSLLSANDREFLKESEAAVQARKSSLLRTNLAELGWGLIFPAIWGTTSEEQQILAALDPLIELRRRAAGKRYKVFSGPIGYRPNDTAHDFLTRLGAETGILDPDGVPYYLLIVGDPETIPFEFQYSLDVQHSVGRIAFDKLEQYATYARSVAAAEERALALERSITFFAPSYGNQLESLQTASTHLLQALRKVVDQDATNWRLTETLGPTATKAQLREVLGGSMTPTFLFAIGSAAQFPIDNSAQLSDQGAPFCDDWNGSDTYGREHYFTGDDILDAGRLLGLVVFMMLPSSAGLSRYDDFGPLNVKAPREIARQAFIANLPRQLLGQANGGALAVIAHVDNNSTSSVMVDNKPQLGMFSDMFRRLLGGATVGAAIEPFAQRYAILAARLAEGLVQQGQGREDVDELGLSILHRTTTDIRNYIILGDPAVRLPVAPVGAPAVARPSLHDLEAAA